MEVLVLILDEIKVLVCPKKVTKKFMDFDRKLRKYIPDIAESNPDNDTTESRQQIQHKMIRLVQRVMRGLIQQLILGLMKQSVELYKLPSQKLVYVIIMSEM